MTGDEEAIRTLIDTWLEATGSGDLDAILPLMADDVVFLGPGRPPVRGRDAFAAATRANAGKLRIEARADIQEIRVFGKWAYCWNQLDIMMTPLSGGAPVHRSGPALSVLRKQPDGSWVIVRDANMVSTVADPPR